jgi:hypothetical protein
MIVKLELLNSKTVGHPMDRDNVRIGYSQTMPEVGHPIIVWYERDGHSRFIRTSRVNGLIEHGSVISEPHYWIAETSNSIYRVEILRVHIENEGKLEALSALNEFAGGR